MTLRFYSPSTGGFYLSDKPRPDDAIHPVTNDEWRSFINAPSEKNKFVRPGPDGAPVLVDRDDLESLDEAIANKCRQLDHAYQRTISAPISYAETEFDARLDVIDSVLRHALPKDYYWLDRYNNKIPADAGFLGGLSDAIFNRQWDAFKALQDAKNKARSAKTKAELK